MPIEIMFLVMGFSGRWDDAAEWVVATLPSLPEATEYRDKALEASKAAIREWKLRPENYGATYVYFDEPTKYDLSHSVRDCGVSYRIVPVPVLSGLPADGLLPAVNAFGAAATACREVNWPRAKLQPAVQPVAEVKGSFSDKLRQALAPA